MTSEALIGLAEVDITPSFTTSLAGYNKAIPRVSGGVHDRIFAKALSIEKDGVATVILAVPSVGVEIESVEVIRSKAGEKLNIPKENILVHSTHSHSCPRCEKEYKAFLERKCVQCVKKSFENRFCGKIGFGSITVDECGKNRRRLLYGGLPVDSEIVVMMVEDESGVLKAVLYNYACHCTVMGVDNKLISEDWPFFANDLIKRRKGTEISTIFIQGASGDVNPGYSAGLSAVGAKIPIRTWEKAQKIGEKVGEAVLAVLDEIISEEIVTLATRTRFFKLPVRRKYPISLKEAENKFEEAGKRLDALDKSDNPSEARMDQAKMALFFASLVKSGAESFYGGEWNDDLATEILSIRMNDNAITTFPGEVFCESGMKVKRDSPGEKTIIAELANPVEAEGYIPTALAYEAGDYEVYCSRYAESAADKLVHESIENIRILF